MFSRNSEYFQISPPTPMPVGYESSVVEFYSAMTKAQIEATGEWLLDVDDRAHRHFEPYSGSTAVRALDLVSKAADQPALRIAAAGLLAVGLSFKNRRLVRAGARVIVAHEAANSIKDALKTQIDRTRPRSADRRDQKKPKKGNHTAKERTSFPSGHSAGVIAAALAFSREFPEYKLPAVGTATILAACQVPRCAHYPTDVAAGLLLGAIIEAITNGVANAAAEDSSC